MSTDQTIVTLLTDFGLDDVYTGVMKGVILSRCESARIVDLTHRIDQGDIPAAGYLLSTAWRYFPAGSVHVAVVDPGVGSGRRILAANVAGHHFIAPDNGLLSDVFDQHTPEMVVAVENSSLFLQPVSDTFHGRDIFAPVAAALAGGTALDELGPAVTSWMHLPRRSAEVMDGGGVRGEVIYVDRFGNLITNITAHDLEGFDAGSLRVKLGARQVITGLVSAYSKAAAGSPLASVGSSGRLEISVNRGNAAERLAAQIGMAVEVQGNGA